MALDRWWALATISRIYTEGDKSLVIITSKSRQNGTLQRLTQPRKNETVASANRKYNTQHLSSDTLLPLLGQLEKKI